MGELGAFDERCDRMAGMTGQRIPSVVVIADHPSVGVAHAVSAVSDLDAGVEREGHERVRLDWCVRASLSETAITRFWAKVNRGGDDACWLWKGATDGTGRYGSFSVNGKLERAHRVAYELLVGPVPEDLVLDHLCKVTLCVNPRHLEPVTQYENIMRGDSLQAQNARKTHCPRGHPYDMVMPNGGRTCRTCFRELNREAVRRYRAKKKAERASRDGQSHSAVADDAFPAPQGYNVAD